MVFVLQRAVLPEGYDAAAVFGICQHVCAMVIY